MFEAINFFCHFGNGDLFLSREFVKEIMNIVPAKKYYYSHGKNSRMFSDIEGLEFKPITDDHLMRNRIYIKDNVLMCNTWIGVDSKYVTPANSCCVLNAYKMYNDMLTSMNLPKLTKNINDYIPQIDYNKLDPLYIGRMETFINITNVNAMRRVLVANCNSQSAQAENFSFDPILTKLSGVFPEVMFIMTNLADTPMSTPNLVFARDIIRTTDGFDLNEISYLSQFCDTIIGRSSGAQIFAMTKENMMDIDKWFLSFTYLEECKSIIWNQPVKATQVWSPSIDAESVIKQCEFVIRRGM